MQSPEHLDEGTVQAWLDGQLSASESAALESHVHACEECSALVAEARGFMAGATRILGALDDVPAARPAIRRERRRRWAMPSAVAATVLIAALSLVSVRNEGTKGVVTAVTRSSAREMVASDTSASAGATAVVTTSPAGVAPTSPPSARGIDEHDATAVRPRAGTGFSDQTNTPEPAGLSVPSRTANERLADAPRLRRMAGTTLQVSESAADASAKAAPAAAAPVPPPVAQARVAAPNAITGTVASSASNFSAGGATITGRITSESGAPIAGASIRLRGTTLGTSTNSDGRFTLTVPPASRPADSVAIDVRHLGHTPVTRTVKLPEQGILAFDTSLPVQTLMLSEIVTTGASEAPHRLAVSPSGCYTAARTPAGVPTRWMLDSVPLQGEMLRPVRDADGRVVGRWSSPASGRVLITMDGTEGTWSGTLSLPRGDEAVTVTLSAPVREESAARRPAEGRAASLAPATATMTVRRARC